MPPFPVFILQPTLKTVCCVCVCEVSPAHLLPWDRGEGEEKRGAGPAHLGQVLGQHVVSEPETVARSNDWQWRTRYCRKAAAVARSS